MQELLNFSDEPSKLGFRLKRLEILNWGTFDKKIWKINPSGQNSLLTGDIGSGKSTIVDAITTLLVPHNRITYNKAAGAEGKERNLKTYIRGEYKNEKFESGGSKAVYLRDEKSHSVILGQFENEALSLEATLAQVFWINASGIVEKFYVFSIFPLNIEVNFTGFGSSISDLKKKLKLIDKILLTDVYRDYSAKFRQEFGIGSEKALELFYQTVSMKSVGNLTDFVRTQMLEQTDVKHKIDSLKKHYDDLNKAYNAVKKAREQRSQLIPIVEELILFGEQEKIIEELIQVLECLSVFFCLRKLEFNREEYKLTEIELSKLESIYKDRLNELERLRDEEKNISIAILQDSLGQKLSELERDIKDRLNSKTEKEKKAKDYKKFCVTLEIKYLNTRESFYENFHRSIEYEESFRKLREELESKITSIVIRLDELLKNGNKIHDEIQSLSKRKNLIPYDNLSIRRQIAEGIGIKDSEIPFVGELLQVREDQKKWVGAIERLLHGFGLSILVSETYYKYFTEYVNKNHLKGKVVFFKTSESKLSKNINRGSVATKLEVKSDSSFTSYLQSEIKSRYGEFICCDTLDEFKNYGKAITSEGLINHGGNRHEKDDRYSILDTTKYILGWTNENKILAFQKELDIILSEISKLNQNKDIYENSLRENREKSNILRDLIKIDDFTEINFEEEVLILEKLFIEKKSLESLSLSLRVLKEKESSIKKEIFEKDEYKNKLNGEIAVLHNTHKNLKLEAEALQIEIDSISLEKKEFVFPQIIIQIDDIIITKLNIQAVEKQLRRNIDIDKKSIEDKNKKLGDSITKKMYIFCNTYKEETIEIDSSIHSGNEFQKFLQKVEQEDLPRHEERFKQELNENTIQNILTFKNELEIQEKEIESRIGEINKSLIDIEYNQGTYIQITCEKNEELEIREFKEMLRNALETGESFEEAYGEKNFFRVKEIIDRFNSGERADIEWTGRVTDVKNWFRFVVDENFINNGEHKERYSDSGGKSGGQKEKLAYTILGSALAYQFGLKIDEPDHRSFRFVVIDEAFGRGSDESTRYGLELFKKLKLQLLIVTPLQKIHIIEDYIKSVHFVSNPIGNHSMVRDLSIIDYKKGKKVS
jgi:uncharacterized protein YPO0396